MTLSAKTTRIGIFGDGQLALMQAESLMKRGCDFLCLSNNLHSPIHSVFPDNITKDVKRFKSECSVFTLENEFYSVSEIEEILEEKSGQIFPDLKSYKHFSHKISQKKFYDSAGVPTARWMELKNKQDIKEIENQFDYPLIIKTSRGGYDGKGVRVVKNPTELFQTLTNFKFSQENPLFVEEKVEIKKELAQGFLSDNNGHLTRLPLVETLQEEGICHLVQYPAQVSQETQSQIGSILDKLIATGLRGIFNFEFFLTVDDKVLINEGAPRTHNSQHLTLNASNFSQFDLLSQYLINPSEAPREVETHPSMMINILGKSDGPCGDLIIPKLSEVKVYPKLYGKKSSSPGRKMGHVNIVDENATSDLVFLAKKILKEYEL
jgi:phosphoribosylaminoimidazole carboxylase PurK protein